MSNIEIPKRVKDLTGQRIGGLMVKSFNRVVQGGAGNNISEWNVWCIKCTHTFSLTQPTLVRCPFANKCPNCNTKIAKENRR